MKAQILGRNHPAKIDGFAPNISLMDHLPMVNSDISAGEIEPMTLAYDHEISRQLRLLAGNYGLKERCARGYTSRCLLPLALSSAWHTDRGLGHVLCWIICNEDITSILELTPAQLITRNAVLDLRVGDVFIFNADVGHAWLSNSAYLMAQMTVSPIKKTLHST